MGGFQALEPLILLDGNSMYLKIKSGTLPVGPTSKYLSLEHLIVQLGFLTVRVCFLPVSLYLVDIVLHSASPLALPFMYELSDCPSLGPLGFSFLTVKLVAGFQSFGFELVFASLMMFMNVFKFEMKITEKFCIGFA